jgi:hypothetical protein
MDDRADRHDPDSDINIDTRKLFGKVGSHRSSSKR